MNIADTITRIRAEIDLKEEQIRVLNLLAERMPGDFRHSICGQFIDFDHPERQTVTEIMQLIAGGKWDKEKASETTINYINKSLSDSVRVRIYGAPPPPSCRMVEEEVVIPAQPERREKVFKMICRETVEATV